MSGNIRPQSSQLAESLWTDPGIKSGISARELISTSKKKKKKKEGNEWSSILSQNPGKPGKSHRQVNNYSCSRKQRELSVLLSWQHSPYSALYKKMAIEQKQHNEYILEYNTHSDRRRGRRREKETLAYCTHLLKMNAAT